MLISIFLTGLCHLVSGVQRGAFPLESLQGFTLFNPTRDFSFSNSINIIEENPKAIALRYAARIGDMEDQGPPYGFCFGFGHRLSNGILRVKFPKPAMGHTP